MEEVKTEETVIRFDLNKFRTLGITDKDAPGMYGHNPDRTKTDVWNDKIDCVDTTPDPIPEEEDLFLAGARSLFLDHIGEGFELRRAFLQNASMPFIRAEIDGFVPPIEGKGGLIARFVLQDKEAFDRVGRPELPTRSGRVSERFWLELQHQMITSGMERAYFVSTFDGSGIQVAEVRRDPVFVSNHIAECVLFWDYIRKGSRPADVEPELQTESARTEEGNLIDGKHQ